MEALRHQGKVANQNGSYWSITTVVCQRTAASNLQTNQDFKAAFTYLPLGVKTEGYQGSLLSIHQQATLQQRGILRFLWLFRHNIITSLEGLAKKKYLWKSEFSYQLYQHDILCSPILLCTNYLLEKKPTYFWRTCLILRLWFSYFEDRCKRRFLHSNVKSPPG